MVYLLTSESPSELSLGAAVAASVADSVASVLLKFGFCGIAIHADKERVTIQIDFLMTNV